MAEEVKVGDYYLHYKNRIYQVTGLGWNTDSDEPSVHYVPTYEVPKDVPLPFNKTLRTFLQNADGKDVPRFRKTLPLVTGTICLIRNGNRTLFVDYRNHPHPIHEGFFAHPGGN